MPAPATGRSLDPQAQARRDPAVWNVTEDGQSLLGSSQGMRQANPGGGAQLVNLWL